MIQARRIGHATFETPDLDGAIDYYTQMNGLVLAEREPGRAFRGGLCEAVQASLYPCALAHSLDLGPLIQSHASSSVLKPTTYWIIRSGQKAWICHSPPLELAEFKNDAQFLHVSQCTCPASHAKRYDVLNII